MSEGPNLILPQYEDDADIKVFNDNLKAILNTLDKLNEEKADWAGLVKSHNILLDITVRLETDMIKLTEELTLIKEELAQLKELMENK